MPNGVLFLPETLWTLKDEAQWRDDFKATFFTLYFKFTWSFNCLGKKFSDTDERLLLYLNWKEMEKISNLKISVMQTQSKLKLSKNSCQLL